MKESFNALYSPYAIAQHVHACVNDALESHGSEWRVEMDIKPGAVPFYYYLTHQGGDDTDIRGEHFAQLSIRPGSAAVIYPHTCIRRDLGHTVCVSRDKIEQMVNRLLDLVTYATAPEQERSYRFHFEPMPQEAFDF